MSFITDTTIESLIKKEEERQQTEITLIASENYASQSVRKAQSSVLTNKYAEGYPGKRYYAGCAIVDQVEQVAIDRCKKLFNVEHANVQPHAGSQANIAAYFAFLQPKDTILGMSLSHGGHLTHGHKVNISGTYFDTIAYGVQKKNELIDYNQINELAHKHKPKLLIVGASAYSRTIDFARCAQIAKEHNTLLLADIAHIAGLIATDLHPSPAQFADIITSTTHKTLRGPRGGLIMCKKQYAEKIDHAIMPGTQGGPFMHTIAAKAICFYEAMQPSFIEYQKQVIKNAQTMAQAFADLGYRIVSGGTDNHLFIIDLTNKNITGLEAEERLAQNSINVSRSCIPFDPQKPWITSGIRIGTPAITTLGYKKTDSQQLVERIDHILQNKTLVKIPKIMTNQAT
jgi:glycine hydroxymethyltransferase